jgi:hypothetical protein
MWSQADVNGDECLSRTEFTAMPAVDQLVQWYRTQMALWSAANGIPPAGTPAVIQVKLSLPMTRLEFLAKEVLFLDAITAAAGSSVTSQDVSIKSVTEVLRRLLTARHLLASGVKLEAEIATNNAGVVMQVLNPNRLTQELASKLLPAPSSVEVKATAAPAAGGNETDNAADATTGDGTTRAVGSDQMKYVFGELLLAGTHGNENENAQSVRDGSFVGQMSEGEEDWEREDEATTRAVGKDHMKSVLEELLRVETHESEYEAEGKDGRDEARWRRRLHSRHTRRLLVNDMINVLFSYLSSGDDCITFDDLMLMHVDDMMAPFFANTTRAINFGEKVHTSCNQGYVEGHVGSHTHTCTETCEFSPPLQFCSRLACTDVLGGEYAFDFATVAPNTVDLRKKYTLSDAVKVQCPVGWMLELRSEKTKSFVVEGLGNIPVLGSSSFLAPSSDVESSFSVKGFPGYGITFPAGAWPKGETRPLTLLILDVSKSEKFEQARAALGGAQLMGKGVYFEPSGIVFDRPVEIAIPYDTSKDLGNLALNVHRLRPGKGLEKVPLSSQRQSPVDVYAKKIYAETQSFSLYAPLATPPEKAPPIAEAGKTIIPVLPPAENKAAEFPLWAIIVISVVGGTLLLCCCVTVVYFRCIRKPPEKTTKQETAPAMGIGKQDARKDRELTSPAIPKNAERQRGNLERSLPEAPEPTPAMTFSSRYAPELPPPHEEAPVLQIDSPRTGRGPGPPITPNASIQPSLTSPQVFIYPPVGLLSRLFAPEFDSDSRRGGEGGERVSKSERRSMLKQYSV